MPIIKELDDRMTMNCQGWKKKQLQQIAENMRVSDSKLLLTIVDEWLENHIRENNGRTNIV